MAELAHRHQTFLWDERPRLHFEIYKFIGDGWILLFPLDFPQTEFFLFLRRLCDAYDRSFKKRVRPVLTTRIPNVGITFGLDRGRIDSGGGGRINTPLR